MVRSPARPRATPGMACRQIREFDMTNEQLKNWYVKSIYELADDLRRRAESLEQSAVQIEKSPAMPIAALQGAIGAYPNPLCNKPWPSEAMHDPADATDVTFKRCPKCGKLLCLEVIGQLKNWRCHACDFCSITSL